MSLRSHCPPNTLVSGRAEGRGRDASSLCMNRNTSRVLVCRPGRARLSMSLCPPRVGAQGEEDGDGDAGETKLRTRSSKCSLWLNTLYFEHLIDGRKCVRSAADGKKETVRSFTSVAEQGIGHDPGFRRRSVGPEAGSLTSPSLSFLPMEVF